MVGGKEIKRGECVYMRGEVEGKMVRMVKEMGGGEM